MILTIRLESEALGKGNLVLEREFKVIQLSDDKGRIKPTDLPLEKSSLRHCT